jgi:hypothetical protein
MRRRFTLMAVRLAGMSEAVAAAACRAIANGLNAVPVHRDGPAFRVRFAAESAPDRTVLRELGPAR